VAQTVIEQRLEPILEPLFDDDSYGYRPRKSAHDAIAITQHRCWRYGWVLEFDIRKLFDCIGHGRLRKALRFHVSDEMLLMYVERWLKAPTKTETGEVVARTSGTPQGGVLSPLLAILFMHYAFDAWMRRTFPSLPFCRFADDGLVHCRTKAESEKVLAALTERMRECGLELHPQKTGIVFCASSNRRGSHQNI
jgi:RNA-directed DNA polymerase